VDIKRSPVTVHVALCVSFLLTISILFSNYEKSAIAQIIPAASNEEVTPLPSNANLGATDPIAPSGPTNSTLSENTQTLEHKYTTTPDPVGTSNGSSLLENIFNNVNEDLKASGITGFYP
jgi:hypothetical protein